MGAGKSALCRALVRALAGEPHLAVPSPTYLLQAVYDAADGMCVQSFPPRPAVLGTGGQGGEFTPHC